MSRSIRQLRTLAVLALVGAGLLAWPAAATAQTVSGSASAGVGSASSGSPLPPLF